MVRCCKGILKVVTCAVLDSDSARRDVSIRQSTSHLCDTYGTILMHRLLLFPRFFLRSSKSNMGGLVIERGSVMLFLQLLGILSFGRRFPATHVLVRNAFIASLSGSLGGSARTGRSPISYQAMLLYMVTLPLKSFTHEHVHTQIPPLRLDLLLYFFSDVPMSPMFLFGPVTPMLGSLVHLGCCTDER
jgi:hypothetical protein